MPAESRTEMERIAVERSTPYRALVHETPEFARLLAGRHRPSSDRPAQARVAPEARAGEPWPSGRSAQFRGSSRGPRTAATCRAGTDSARRWRRVTSARVSGRCTGSGRSSRPCSTMPRCHCSRPTWRSPRSTRTWCRIARLAGHLFATIRAEYGPDAPGAPGHHRARGADGRRSRDPAVGAPPQSLRRPAELSPGRDASPPPGACRTPREPMPRPCGRCCCSRSTGSPRGSATRARRRAGGLRAGSGR